MDFQLIRRNRFTDYRGQLVEFLTTREVGNSRFGHIYFVTFKESGIIRGNHFHKKKCEYFGLVQGKVKIIIEDIRSKKNEQFILDSQSSEFELIKIGPRIAHAVEALTPNTILVDYFTKPYNPQKVDDFRYELIKPTVLP